MVAPPKPSGIRIASTGEANFARPGHRISYRSSSADRDLSACVRYPTACLFPVATTSGSRPGRTIGPQRRLGDFIRENQEAILQGWDQFARIIEPGISPTATAELRSHAQQLLVALAADLGAGETARCGRKAEAHAVACLHSGYTIVHLVAEFHALRHSVLSLWSGSTRRASSANAGDMMRFNEAVDRAMHESVAQYQRQVDQAQNMFLAILGHDLRNPLGTLVAGASLMMNDVDLAAKNVMMASRMYSSARRMKKLIDDLIDFTRTHLGTGIPVKASQGNLVTVCWQVVNELRTAHPNRFVDLRAPPKLDAVFDPDRIAQVLSNLIGNALQYGNQVFPVRVWVSATDDRIKISVNNRGPIIPPDRTGQIFDAMVRLAYNAVPEHSERTSLGIGLYISREIVRAHGGEIDVVSDAENGTTFTVTMPRTPSGRSIEAGAMPNPAQNGQSDAQLPRIK